MAALKKFQIQAKMGEKFTIESTLGNHVVYVDQAQAGMIRGRLLWSYCSCRWHRAS